MGLVTLQPALAQGRVARHNDGQITLTLRLLQVRHPLDGRPMLTYRPGVTVSIAD